MSRTDPTPADDHRVSATESETTMARIMVPKGGAKDGVPIRIGRYRVLEEIGRGGMGVVYKAQQFEPVERQVALKLLHPHKGDRHAQRFREECQTLARMRHTNIAQMLDCGETEEGHPFLVLEHIDGEPLTDFCDHNRLSVRQRIELFIKVCDGIQHAHQKGVIHRDLKPSNILVCRQGTQAVPKIIDFGVAKLIDSSRELTRAGQLIGSPSHMSPEQLQGAAGDVDTRADVYALGNVLYELLTGTMVFIAASGSFYDYMVQITRNEAKAPSARCVDLASALAPIAADRSTSAAALVQRLRGDLDAVVLKALAKERDDRYPSASGLGADLQRHLDGLPVAAHPGGRAYQLRKLIARHKVPVLATVLVTLALGIATVATSVSLGRARTAERHAQMAAAQTQAVNRILEDILSSPDPAVDGKDVTLLAVLDRTAEDVVTNLVSQPEAAGGLLHVLGRTYSALGVYPRAGQYLEQALRLREEHRAVGDVETAATREALVRLYLAAGDLPVAESLAERHLTVAEQDIEPAGEGALSARLLRGEVYYERGKYAEAERDLRRAFDGLANHLGRNDPTTLTAHLALGKALNRLDQPDAAEAIFRSVHDARARQLGTDHPDTIETANLLANVLYAGQQYVDAEAQYRDSRDRAARRFGMTHPYTLKLRMNVANAVYKQGRYSEAESIFREVLATQRQTLGEEHPSTLVTLNNLGNALRRQGRLSDAEATYREAMTRQRAVLGRGHDETLRSTLNLIRVLAAADRRAAALALIDDARTDHPRQINILRFKRDVEASLGRLRTATDAAAEAVAVNPDNTDDQLAYARLLALDGQADTAWQVYEKVLRNAEEPRAVAAGALESLRNAGQRESVPRWVIEQLEQAAASS